MNLLLRPKLGSWRLNDLFEEPSGKKLDEFLASITSRVEEVENRRKELNDEISSSDFESILHSIEEISEMISIIGGYAHLSYAANTTSNEFAALMTKIGVFASNLSNRLLFFDLWFKKEASSATAQRLIESMPSIYRQYLTHQRLFAKYTLSEPEEKIITTLGVTGTSALIKI